MSDSAEHEFKKIQTIHPAAVTHTEGGNPVVILPNFPFQGKTALLTMDLLLYPRAHTGYSTRLFFQHSLAGQVPGNWTEHCILGRQWWALSWQGIEANLSWIKILFGHLEAVK